MHYITVGPSPGIRNVIIIAAMVHNVMDAVSESGGGSRRTVLDLNTSAKPELVGFCKWPRSGGGKDRSQFGKLFLRSARRSQLVPLSRKRSSPRTGREDLFQLFCDCCMCVSAQSTSPKTSLLRVLSVVACPLVVHGVGFTLSRFCSEWCRACLEPVFVSMRLAQCAFYRKKCVDLEGLSWSARRGNAILA